MSMTGGPGNAVQILIVGAVGIAICYIAATRTRRVWATGLAVVGAGLLIPGPGGLDLAQLRGGVAVVTIIAWLIGHSIRQAQAHAEMRRVQTAAQTVMAERLRIARELHDMVAHSIGIIAIQAGAGRRVFDARPAEARDALAAIEATSRETLSGLRRMVTGLRRAEPGPRPGPRVSGTPATAVAMDWRNGGSVISITIYSSDTAHHSLMLFGDSADMVARAYDPANPLEPRAHGPQLGSDRAH